MNDLKNTIWNKRLPSFFGILFLVLSIGTIGWLSSNEVLFGTKAAASNVPKNIQVSNITNSSFSVSYLTDGEVPGTVNFGKSGKTDQVTLDDRDQAKASPTNHTVHYFTIKKLDSSTKYSFTITSGDKNFSNNDVPYQMTTAGKISDSIASTSAVSGKVVLDDGNAPAQAIVYVSTSDSQTLSTLTDSNGSYNIDLAKMRKKDLSDFIQFSLEDILHLQIVDSTRQSNVSVLQTQANQIPLVILSRDYDFLISSEPLETSPTASDSGNITPVAFPTTSGSTTSNPQIVSPEKNQEFKDQQPLFKGTAAPDTNVQITIQSDQEIATTVSADTNGNWQYRPTTPLAPGNHTIIIKTTDSSGLVKTITQSFVVFASGSQFTQPSVSPSVIPTATQTPTVGPTNVPTNVPAATLTPTATPTLATTTTTSSPTSIQTQIPVTGNATLVASIIGIVSVIGIGALLFFFTAL